MITRIKQNEDVINYLKQNLHENLNILNFLKYKPDVDVLIFEDDVRHGIILEVVLDGEERDCFLATRNQAFLRTYRASMDGDYAFQAVPCDIAEMILDGDKPDWCGECKTFVLTGDFSPVDVRGYQIERLTMDDAAECHSFYPWKSDDSINQFYDSIERRETACVRIGGELAAWVLVHADDGSMGPLYTKEEFRRKGLGEMLVSRLIADLLVAGYVPYAHIQQNNDAPLNMIAKFNGMTFSHDCWFFGIEKRGLDE